MPTPRDQLTSRLRRIQQALGVTADGVLGPETLTALESRLEIQVSKRAVSLECSRASLELIVRFEVGSRQRYEKEFQRPTWPGGMSGVTIGIGYDLGMTPKAQITSDWECYLFEPELAALLAVQGVTGPAAKTTRTGGLTREDSAQVRRRGLIPQDTAAFCRAHAGRISRASKSSRRTRRA